MIKRFLIGLFIGAMLMLSVEAFCAEFWGSTRAQIKARTTARPIEDSANVLAYMDFIWGYSAMTGFVFEKNKLVQLNYIFLVPLKSKEEVDAMWNYVIEQATSTFGFDTTPSTEPIKQYEVEYFNPQIMMRVIAVYDKDIPIIKIELKPTSGKTKEFFKKLNEHLEKAAKNNKEKK